MSSCDKEVHGSGAGLLHGWDTELNEVVSVARRSLVKSLARNCWKAQKGEQRFEPWLLQSRL